MQALPQTLRVFAMDHRGNGDADKPADGYAPANFADDIEAFMDRLAYSRLSCSSPRAVPTSRNRSLSGLSGRYAGRGLGVPDHRD
jgi:hypothetical protein